VSRPRASRLRACSSADSAFLRDPTSGGRVSSATCSRLARRSATHATPDSTADVGNSTPASRVMSRCQPAMITECAMPAVLYSGYPVTARNAISRTAPSMPERAAVGVPCGVPAWMRSTSRALRGVR
jgi:hypothetical protein